MNTSERILQCENFSREFASEFAAYVEMKYKNEKTRLNTFYVIRDLCTEEKKDFLELTENNVYNYFSRKKSVLTKRTLIWQRSVMIGVAKYLKERGIIDVYNMYVSIDLGVDDPNIDINKLPSFEDINKVFEYLKSQDDKTTFLVMTLALRMALTLSTIRSLKFKQFIMDKTNKIGIKLEPKSAYSYCDNYVSVPDDVVYIMNNFFRDRSCLPEEHVFLSKRGKVLSDRLLQTYIMQACINAGVNPFSLRQLRLLSKSLMYSYGADINKIAECTETSLRWVTIYDSVVEQLKDNPVDYPMVTVRW